VWESSLSTVILPVKDPSLTSTLPSILQ